MPENTTRHEQLDSQQGKTPTENILTKKKIDAKTFVSTFGTSIFVQGCTLIQGVILARLLGPAGRGDYAAVILWPSIFANIGLFGTNFAIGRLSAKGKDVGLMLRSGFILTAITSVFTILLAFMLVPFLIPPDRHRLLPLVRLCLLYIPICQLASNLAAVDQGTGNFFRLNLIRSFHSPVLILCLVVIFVSNLYELLWFVVALLLAYSAVTVCRAILLLRDHKIIGPIYPIHQIVRDGFSFGLVGIAVQGYHYADRILLLWLLEPSHMGFYIAAWAASSVITIVAGSMGLVSFTITAQQDESEGFERVASIFRKALTTKILLGAILALAMPFLLPLVYGSKFNDAVKPAIILIGGMVFSGLSLLLDQCMRGQGKPFAGLVGRIASILTMIAIGFPAIKIVGWGTVGMAVAFLIAQLVYLLILGRQILMHYKNSKVSAFMPRLNDFKELLLVLKKCLMKFGFGKCIGL